jgi:hypothetical protein
MSNRRSATPTLKELKQLLDKLAAKVEREQAAAAVSPRWWRDHAGRFENDPLFDEIVRLGRQERKRLSVKKRGAKKRARS